MKLSLLLALMCFSQSITPMAWKQDLDTTTIKTITKVSTERNQTYTALFTDGKSVVLNHFLQGPLKGTFHGTTIETTYNPFNRERREFELPLKSPAEYYALLQGLYEAQLKKTSEAKTENQ